MSLRPVPVCNNCSRCTEVSISCTKCYQICCATCLKLRNDLFDTVTMADDSNVARTCLKCCGDISIKQEPKEQPIPVTQMGRKWKECTLHGKPRKLFCMNCFIPVCGDCLGEKEEHEMHHIDNLSVLYQEKFAEMQQKLGTVEKIVARSSAYKNNLETIEKEEQSILNAVSTMTADAISDISSQTAKRKATLKHTLQLLADKSKRLSEFLGDVKQLSPEDFLAQRSEIEKQCHDIMGDNGTNFTLEPVDDFKCDLVPTYKFANFSCAGFATASNHYVFQMHSAHDVIWTVNVYKSHMLQVKLSPTKPTISKFPHKMIVIISHEDPMKEIRKVFDLGCALHTFDIVQLTHLVENGFFNITGTLMLKIGVRPLNITVEKLILQNNFNSLKLETTKLINEARSKTKAYDNEYFSANLKLLMNKFEASKSDRFGTTIIDDDDRHWNLKVRPTLVYQRPTQIEAYVVLQKGPNTNCNYYIELKHKIPAKSIVKSGTYHFNRRASHGWNCFVTWNEINDAGFHHDGYLRFRYGIKPLKN